MLKSITSVDPFLLLYCWLHLWWPSLEQPKLCCTAKYVPSSVFHLIGRIQWCHSSQWWSSHCFLHTLNSKDSGKYQRLMRKKCFHCLLDLDTYHSQCNICITEDKLCVIFSQTQRSIYIKKILTLFSPNNLVAGWWNMPSSSGITVIPSQS